jgi:hypothetical protein
MTFDDRLLAEMWAAGASLAQIERATGLTKGGAIIAPAMAAESTRRRREPGRSPSNPHGLEEKHHDHFGLVHLRRR